MESKHSLPITASMKRMILFTYLYNYYSLYLLIYNRSSKPSKHRLKQPIKGLNMCLRFKI